MEADRKINKQIEGLYSEDGFHLDGRVRFSPLLVGRELRQSMLSPYFLPPRHHLSDNRCLVTVIKHNRYGERRLVAPDSQSGMESTAMKHDTPLFEQVCSFYS